MKQLREVEIIVSNQTTGQWYNHATSFPIRDRNSDGLWELYTIPVYKVFIRGTNENSRPIEYTWDAMRFMPYYNPNGIVKEYKAKGWLTAGLHQLSKRPVQTYKSEYRTHSEYSLYDGAIVLKETFYIHAGPMSIDDESGYWGSAGCVEIIGDFYLFKENIRELSGSDKKDSDAVIQDLIDQQKLYIEMEPASPPNLWGNVIKQDPPPKRRQ